jgi:hypothetical protein
MPNTSGFSSIGICKAGTLLTVPEDVILLGMTRNEDLKATGHKEIKVDRDDHDLPNMNNLLFSGETLQPSLYAFNKLVGYREGNCDIQAVSRNGAVFQFLAASNPLGLEPKYIINDDYRIIQVDFERAWSKEAWQAILLAASTNQAVALGTGRDSTKIKRPQLTAIECPSTVSVGSVITKRSLTIEPKRKAKDIRNISLFDRLLITAMYTLEHATFTAYYNQIGKGDLPELWWKEANSGAYYDQLKFAADVLAQKPEYNNTGTKTELNVTHKGAAVIEDMVLETGAGKGDAANGTGVAGGTLKFGY